VTRLLLISALACGGIGLLLWLGSHWVAWLERRSDATRLISRLLTTLMGILLVTRGVLEMRAAGNAWPAMRAALLLAVIVIFCWGGTIAGWFGGLFSSVFDGGSEQEKAQPLYSMAEAKRKQGKLREAMYEIQAQLEKFPNDFRGQMLLAEIQAEHADDLSGAEATIHRLCSQPKRTPQQIAGALATLADWHLRFDQDVDAARAALQGIVDRFPETELAYNASKRLAHIAETGSLIESRAPRTIVMHPISDIPAHKLNLADVLPVTDPATEAARLVAHLNTFPNDTEAREQLAKIYVDHYQRLDLATEQMEVLINQPTESPRRIAHWSNILADLQIRSTGHVELAAETLSRLIERFPTQAFSEVARQRLSTLSLEVKRYEQDRVVKFKS
jgi:outer membrane protein assembly factor BamD (BamD/ComL family)